MGTWNTKAMPDAISVFGAKFISSGALIAVPWAPEEPR